ncbi:MAG: metallophosphatase domain-containing protein [Anaerovoracaceae bacterium]
MKIIFISDTHGKHQQIDLPAGDMIIHAGDISRRGRVDEVDKFLDWFASLDYKYKIFIAGNHDFCFENKLQGSIQDLMPEGVYYLCDSGVEIDGIRIYGSPITPFFFNWAFNRHRGDDIRRYWDLIPEGTDILITHGPAYGILDRTEGGDNAGCEELLSAIKRIKPKYHLFGHIHEGYGVFETDETVFINGSSLDENYQAVHAPIIIEI